MFKRPPVQVYIALCLIKTEIQVMYTSCVLYLSSKRLILVYRTSAFDGSSTDNLTFLTINAQCNSTTCIGSGSSNDIELLSSLTKVNTTQANILTIINVEDIHIAFTSRCRHILYHTSIRNTHFCTLQGAGKDACQSKKKNTPKDRKQTTALLVLRALEAGIKISDLDFFELGEIYDILIEHGNDSESYDDIATQEWMDRF